MKLPLFSVLSLIAVVTGSVCASPDLLLSIRVDGGRFIDTEGREVLLHGINLSEKSRQRGYVSWHGPEDFARMRSWGFNCIRLSIFWDGIEPEPGRYDEEYLRRIDQRIEWAKQNGLYVLLDMHQDLYSAHFPGGGDGAPPWAVLDGGKPDLRTGPTWGMAYFTSRAIQTAFDNFWANAPAPDEVGLQDHFAAAWQHVAKRYADETAVLGYDLFNEPFPGSRIRPTLLIKVKAAVEKMAEQRGTKLSLGSLMEMVAQADGLLEFLDDLDVYRAFTDAGTHLSQEFERTTLADFHNRVAAAIREVDQTHILFMEAHLFTNGGTPSGVVPILMGEGEPDPQQALALHGYDLVTDTEKVAQAKEGRVRRIFREHARTGERVGFPVLIGEWGAFYGNQDAFSAAEMVVRQLEEHRFSDTYWSYGSRGEVDNAPYLPLLARPYPQVVAGSLLQIESNFGERTFHCRWQEDPDISAATRIYVPTDWFPDGYRVHLEPAGTGWQFDPIMENGKNGYLTIPPVGEDTERWLVVYGKGRTTP